MYGKLVASIPSFCPCSYFARAALRGKMGLRYVNHMKKKKKKYFSIFYSICYSSFC